MKMTGLILTNVYMVYRNISIYMVGAIIIGVVLLVYMGDEVFFGSSTQQLAPKLMMLLSILPTFEMLKIGAKSGYDKYVLTLPVRRGTIVKSHYSFLVFMLVFALLVMLVTLYVFSLFSWISFDMFLWQEILSIAAIYLLAGAIVLPAIYLFGAQRSDIFVLTAFFGAMSFAGVLSKALQSVARLIGVDLVNLTLTTFVVFVIIFTTVCLLTYVLSYFISLAIYRKKEF